MLVVMILMMLLKLLYDGISVFCSEVIVSAKNPYTTYRNLISENYGDGNKDVQDGGDTHELTR